MKLKGTTRIELTDIHTGEVQVTEESNFVTNALNQFCQPILKNQDVLPTSFFKREGTLSIEAMMRGLLLFDKTFDENADIFFPPQDFEQIGHAGNITYTGSDLSLGSYNNNQSIVSNTADERTYVWDFTAEQANGIIRSICLTTQEGGIIGHGTKTPQEFEPLMVRHFSNFIKSKIVNAYPDYFYPYNKVPLYLSLKKGYLLQCDFSKIPQGVLSFDKVSLDDSKVDIFKKFQTITSIEAGVRAINYIGNGYTDVEKIEINVADILGSGTYFGIAQDGKYLYITDKKATQETTSANAWQTGTSITLLKVDLEELTYETLQVTNTTGVSLAIRASFDSQASFGNMFGVASGYLYARSWVQTPGREAAHLYAINLANNTIVRQVETANGSKEVVGVYSYIDGTSFIMSICGKPFFTSAAQRPYENNNGGENSVSQMSCTSNVDFKKRYLSALLSTLGSEDSSHTQMTGRTFPVDDGLYYAAEVKRNQGSNTSSYYIVCGMPNALMTINNLATPVEKLPSQTMRITYKLTKE